MRFQKGNQIRKGIKPAPLTPDGRERLRLANLGKVQSEATRRKIAASISKKQVGANNTNWVGDNFTYQGIHSYMRKQIPRPELCPRCGLKKNRMNLCYKDHSAGWKNQIYTRDVKMWEWLCGKCHMELDGRLDKFVKNAKEKKWDRGRKKAGFYQICSGRGTGAICECGHKEDYHLLARGRHPTATHDDYHWCVACRHEGKKDIHDYKPLSCELVSVMDEEEWLKGVAKQEFFDNMSENEKKLLRYSPEQNQVIRKIIDGLKTPVKGFILEEECELLKEEAHREGFENWQQLNDWIEKHYNGRPKMWRYEFRR